MTLTVEQERNLALIERARSLLKDVAFLDYRWIIALAHGGVILRAEYEEPDLYEPLRGKARKEFTRKWILSPEMSDTEIVQTAFKCAYTSMEHRTRTHFTYKGALIFGPEIDIDDLVKLCQSGRERAGGRKR